MTKNAPAFLCTLIILAVIVIGVGFLPSDFDKSPPTLQRYDDGEVFFSDSSTYGLHKSDTIEFEKVTIIQQDHKAAWLEVTYHYTPLGEPQELFLGARQLNARTLTNWMAYGPSDAIKKGTGKAIIRLTKSTQPTTEKAPFTDQLMISAYPAGGSPIHETIFGDYPRHWCSTPALPWDFPSVCRRSLLSFFLPHTYR